jgi:LEA14-like dessication related protein
MPAAGCTKTLTVLALAAGLSACTPHLERPQFTLLSVTASELRFDEQRFKVRVHVMNPNGIELPVTALHCTVELAGTSFGEGELTAPVTVPAHGGNDVELGLRTHLAMSLPPILARLQSHEALEYHLAGVIETGLPFAPSIRFEDHGSLAR